jgi:hypothetical protein
VQIWQTVGHIQEELNSKNSTDHRQNRAIVFFGGTLDENNFLLLSQISEVRWWFFLAEKKFSACNRAKSSSLHIELTPLPHASPPQVLKIYRNKKLWWRIRDVYSKEPRKCCGIWHLQILFSLRRANVLKFRAFLCLPKAMKLIVN